MLPLLLAIAFAAANVLALGGAAWLLRGRGHHSDWAISLLFSSAATVGGTVLLLDLGIRLVASLTGSSVQVLPPSLTTLWLAFVWSVFLGPTFFATAFLARAKATPRVVRLLQLFQILTWACSGLMLVLITVQA